MLLAFSLTFSGCEASSAIENENSNIEKGYGVSSTKSISSNKDSNKKTNTNSEEHKYRKEYDESGSLYLVNNNTGDVITPFPDGWSAERISKMVTIDGYQLTLPCKVSDILALSDDFRAEEPFDYGDGTSSFQIWYEDVIAVSGIYNNDDETIELIYVGGNKYTEIEGIDSTEFENIFNLFNDLSKSSTGSVSSRYIESDQDMIYSLHYTGKNKYSIICLSWEEI